MTLLSHLDCRAAVRLERDLDVLHGVLEVEDVGVFLARIGSVQSRKRLDRLEPSQLAVHVHGAQLGLVEPRLVFLGDDEDLIGVGVEAARQLSLGDRGTR